MLPEAGKTYTKMGSNRTVVDIELKPIGQTSWVFYTKDKSSLVRKCPLEHFQVYYMSKEKPLDKAFKEMDKEIFIKTCQHTNIRKDYFFSGMMYLTCKDCGKPLN